MADSFPFHSSRRSPRVSTIRIPKDQAHLLQRPDSWINVLESGHSRLGIINIPPSALTTFTEFYRRRHLASILHQENVGKTTTQADLQNGTQSPFREASSPESPVFNSASSSSPVAVTPHKMAVATANNEREDESPPGEPMTSWPVTPTDPKDPPARTVRKSPPTNSITPIALALSSANSRRPRNRSAEPPRSSMEQEEGFDVAVANVEKLPSEAVNRLPVRYAGSQLSTLDSPRIFSPPPCGQGDPYSTQRESAAAISQTTPAHTASSVTRRPDVPARRPRRMEAPSFTPIEPDQVYPNRHLSTIRPGAGRDSASSSLEENSLGMTPNIHRLSPERPKRRNPTNGIISDQEPHRKKQRNSQHNRACTAPGDVLIPATPLRTDRPALGVGDVKPFKAFKLIYPQYSGTLQDFIRACICLKFLQDQDLLSDFLYDDFIRAFTEGYVDHVGAAEKPLPAHQWYNRIGGKPAYDEMIIKRSNLDHVFDAYPQTTEEAANEVNTSTEKLLKLNQPKDEVPQVNRATQTDTPSASMRLPRPLARAASKSIMSSQLSSGSTKSIRGCPPPSIESHDPAAPQSSPPPRPRPSQREHISATATPARVIPASQPRSEFKSQRVETGSIINPRTSKSTRTASASQMSDVQVTETPLRHAAQQPVQDIIHPSSPLIPASRVLREHLEKGPKATSIRRPMSSSPRLDRASKSPSAGTMAEPPPRSQSTTMRSVTPHPPKPNPFATSSKAGAGLPLGYRHSLPPSRPGRATHKDALKTVANGKVQKPTGRRSLGGSRGGGIPMSREEALRMHILRRKAEMAASSSPVPARKA